MTTILEHWQRQSQTMKARTDDKILEEVLCKIHFLTSSERKHLDEELSWMWLRKDYKKDKGE